MTSTTCSHCHYNAPFPDLSCPNSTAAFYCTDHRTPNTRRYSDNSTKRCACGNLAHWIDD